MRSDLIIEKAFEALDEYGYTKEEMMYYDQLGDHSKPGGIII